MPQQQWSIHVQKDYLKFSAAHFLIFEDGEAERLHGHNYKVEVTLRSRLDAHGMVLDFRSIKPIVRNIVDELDEHLLIPGEHAVLRATRRDDGLTTIDYRERHYQVPSGEVLILPLNNTSAENLARYVCHQLVDRLKTLRDDLPLEELTVSVEETPGQQGIYHYLGE